MWRSTLVLWLLVFLAPYSAQAGLVSSWRVGLLAGDDNGSSGVFGSWTTVLGGFVEAVRVLDSRAEVASRITGRNVRFDKYQGELFSTPDVHWSDSGENMRSLDIRLTLRATPGGRRPALYFGPTVGVIVADVGKVTLTGRNESGQITNIRTARGTDEVLTKLLVGANAGVMILGENRRMGAGVEGSILMSTGETRMSWVEFAVVVRFR